MFDAFPLRHPAIRARHGLGSVRVPTVGALPGLLSAPIDELWDELRGFGPLIVQVRHRYARLITRREAPDLADRAEATGLACRPELFAFPVLRRCACARCACLPAVRIHDETAGECLQLCAPPGFPRERWSRLRRFFGPVDLDSLDLDEAGGKRLRRLPAEDLARLPSGSLFKFFGRLSRMGEGVRATLRTPAATLATDILPERFFVEENVLTLGDSASTLQVALPGLHGLMLHAGSAGGPLSLHLAGPDATSLLTFSPAESRVGASVWRDWFSEISE